LLRSYKANCKETNWRLLLSFLLGFFFLFFFLEVVVYDFPVPDLSKSELCGRQREDWKPESEGTFRLMPLRY
jgi:hypothetical protein